MEQDELEWELVLTDVRGDILETIWRNRKYEIFKEEVIKPDGIDTSYTLFKTNQSFNTFAELVSALND